MIARQRDEKRERPADLMVAAARNTYGIGRGPGGAFLRDRHLALGLGAGEAGAAAITSEVFDLTGETPSTSATGDALAMLRALARECSLNEPAIRVWSRRDLAVIDAGDSDGTVYVVRPGRVEVTTSAPKGVLFERTGAELPMPRPTLGTDAETLEAKLAPHTRGLDGTARLLFIAFASFALTHAHVAGPVAVITAAPGAGKSTLADALKRSIDPGVAMRTSAPPDPAKLPDVLRSGWCITLDNLRGVRAMLADALCRCATGDHHVTRQLYSNRGTSIERMRRTVILTTTNGAPDAPDLLDRSLVFSPAPIAEAERRSEEDLAEQFTRDHPIILGGLLELAARAMQIRRDLAPEDVPADRGRLADFGTWVHAIGLATGNDGLLGDYLAQRRDQLADNIDADEVIDAVVHFVRDVREWEGSAGDLLVNLEGLGPEHSRGRAWPTNAAQVGARLSRGEGVLRAHGITIERTRTSAGRRIRLTLLQDSSE